MEIQANQLILGATVVFIVGLLVFSVIFQAVSIMQQMKQNMGYNLTQEDLMIAQTLAIIPSILALFYFSFVGVVIWYVMKKSREKAEREYI
ncbi:hypothetical protein DRN62_03320 [Nanoarchaeota archaeon]|nr:MAG: hypothetical protein DRN62_03320 [Nanoarchaeota archaeon]